ncbi:MAG: ORF6N domain-containing protein [Candidatus Omnitrophica bacterium]|nr:ORF6N domain-containing protein [Candidatus Omnitrophota bacterium]
MKRKKKISARPSVPHKTIESKILLLRGEKGMLDSDLALLYNVETKQLKRAVNRNIERFPDDFMFKLTGEEYLALRRHFGTLKRGTHAKYLPYAFTEQGVAMLSSVLNSKRAILVNIQIVRTFTKLRKMLLIHEDLRRKIETMERKYDKQFKVVFDAIRQLLTPLEKPKRRIGFHLHND